MTISSNNVGDNMEKKIIYLVRHGETYLNRYKKMQGWADSPLTNEGKHVARETGRKLSSISFDRVFTSDLGRTIETAEIIIQQNNFNKKLVLNKMKAFRETFFGSFEGEYSEVAWEKIAKDNGYNGFKEFIQNTRFEEVMNLVKSSDPLHHAESYREFWERLEKGLNQLISSSKKNNETILLVTHGNTIRNIVNKFSDEFKIDVEIKNSSITVIEYSKNIFKVNSFNQ